MSELRIKENQYYSRIIPSQISSGNIELGLQESLLPLHPEHCRYESCTKEEFEEFQKSATLKNLEQVANKNLSPGQYGKELEEADNPDIRPEQGYKGVGKAFLVLIGIIALWVLLANVLPQKDRNTQ
jgi:hypothetical protein